MNKIGLIIWREFSTRVRKKSFIIMTLLAPILSAGLFILPAYLALQPGEDKIILVLDKVHLMDGERGRDDIQFQYIDPRKVDLDGGKKLFKKSGHYGFLYIPDGGNFDPDFIGKKATLYTLGDVNVSVENYIENQLEKYIQREKLKADGVDPEKVARAKTNITLNTLNIEDDVEKESLGLEKMGIGYVAGFMIYIFVFLYGVQIMRGVIEEKTSRVVEVMISSVRPFQLMMGKILGLASVAILQFIIWIVFASIAYSILSVFILGDALDASNVASQAQAAAENPIFDIMAIIESLPIGRIVFGFLFFFIFGYLLYAAMFAAIGSAVDKESDTQQFMLPVSLPLIAAIIVLITALDKPDGPIAFWFSIIPFTSPVVMMARIPFDVPIWQLILSMSLLVATFFFMTWVAGKIYRTGILMYGKKPKLKELLKWIRYGG